MAAMLTAGLAFAGWGGWYGAGPEREAQGVSDEQGPWMRPGPRWGGPEAEDWQGGPGRGRGGPDASGPHSGGPRTGRGWGRRWNRPVGPGTRFGRAGRPGRGYQEADICPYCQGTGHIPVIQGRPMRGRWERDLRGGRAGRGFRRGEALPDRGPWNGPGRGWPGRNFGPRGRDFEQGPGPMMRRGPREDNRRRRFGPGRGGRDFRRGDAPTPEGQGQGLDQPDRDDRPEEKNPDVEPPAPPDANSPKEESVTSEET